MFSTTNIALLPKDQNTDNMEDGHQSDTSTSSKSTNVSTLIEKYKDDLEGLKTYHRTKREELKKVLDDDKEAEDPEEFSDFDEFEERFDFIEDCYKDKLKALNDRVNITKEHIEYLKELESNPEEKPLESESTAKKRSLESDIEAEDQEKKRSKTEGSPLDYVIEKQSSEMPDIFESDGDG